MTRHILAIFSFLLASLAPLGAGGTFAQDLTMPPVAPMDEGYTLPDADGYDLPEALPPGEPTPADGVDLTLPPEAGPEPVSGVPYGDYDTLAASNADLWGCRPALTESTGTWLRRGYWYSELDAVVLNRMWKRDDLIMGFDNTSFRDLRLERTDPGASASARLTLGRFLFRDTCNRDHTLEFTAFGGGDSFQDDTLTSSTGGNTLLVPVSRSDFNDSFDGADSMDISYEGRFSSFELNYRVKERMRHDRMVLTPSGTWVRTANEGITKQYLVGLRYMDLVDVLDWNATNVSSLGGVDGNYHIETNNDLFGIQFGCSMLLEHDRWNLEIMGKGGPYVNDVKSRERLTFDDGTGFFVGNREPNLSFIGEFQLIGRYHLRPNLSLRAGWQMMYVSSVALAPDQVDFSPDEGRFPYEGDPFYNGAIFGAECYW